MKILPLLLALTFFSTLTFSKSASAIERDGFLIGFDVGSGYNYDSNLFRNSFADKHNFGFDVSLHIGGSFTRELSLMGLVVGHVGPYDDGSTSGWLGNSYGGPAVQFILGDRFFLRGGLGYAYTSVTNEETFGNSTIISETDRFGFGLVFNPGVEVYQSEGTFAMDINYKIIPQFYRAKDGGFALLNSLSLGFTWF